MAKSKIWLFNLLLLLFFSGINAQKIENTEWEKVIPSDGIPENINIQKGNNNLDLVFYENEYYLAFRTAPNHFASKKAQVIVLSSKDLESWEFEKEIHLNSDLREPRFAVYKNTLFLYFFEGGKKFWKFEPQHLYVTYKDEKGKWTENERLSNLDGYVPWRLRVHEGLLYLSAYYGKNAYNSDPVELRLFTSENGMDFKPISKEPQILHPKGIGEGEFIFDQEGNIWGVARSEFDGSYTFFASKDSIDKWDYKYSEFKYDSSLIFEDNGTIFLIARRNLDGDGRYVQRPGKERRNLLRYSFTKKKTAIFKLNKTEKSWIHLKDFKSTGDTAFPALVKKSNGKYILMNYSSDITKKEKNWIGGQLGKTYIYKTEMSILNPSK